MKATELRIGNLVTQVIFKATHDEEKEILVDWQEIWWISKGTNSYKPIPLTEKWLINFGFEEIKEDDDNYDYMLEIGDLDCFSEWENGHLVGLRVDGVNYILRFVHELQNLYFADRKSVV